MLSVEEALKKIQEIEVELFTKEILLKDSNGYVLASRCYFSYKYASF
nr:hypothetical protein [Flavobacterium covae]